jgi:N6-adenosine-specific RNA methylase IME4
MMTEDEVRDLPIRDLADVACRLFLWTTSRYLPVSFEILRGWGFRYKQTLVWHKTGNPSPFGGSVAPNHAEFLLVATRGAPFIGRWPSSVVSAPAQRQHSRKPEVFLDLVEQVSPGPYLELFARRQRLGWDTWGNEALEHVELGS